MKIHCSFCSKEIKRPGALLFSPPYDENCVEKWHLCGKCYDKALEFLDTLTVEEPHG